MFKNIWNETITGEPVQPAQQPQGNGVVFGNVGGPVEVVNNKIYFYSAIRPDSALRLNRALEDVSNDLLVKEKTLGLPEGTLEVKLFINSPGGYMHDGLSIMDEIIKCKVPVTTIVDGITASAATFFSIVGKKRLMKKHSHVLIHQLSAGMWGTYSECEDQFEAMTKFMKEVKDLYKEYTKIPMKKLEELMKRDLYFSAAECLEYKIIDEII